MNFPSLISTSNRWRIDEDVSIGMVHLNYFLFGSELITIIMKIFCHSIAWYWHFWNKCSLRKIWYELHSLHILLFLEEPVNFVWGRLFLIFFHFWGWNVLNLFLFPRLNLAMPQWRMSDWVQQKHIISFLSSFFFQAAHVGSH